MLCVVIKDKKEGVNGILKIKSAVGNREGSPTSNCVMVP